MKISELFEAISKISSKIEKEKMLKDNMSPLLEQILKDTYGPEKYNVKKYEKLEGIPDSTIDKNYEEFHKLLQTLAKRELTGDAARRAVATTISYFSPEDRIWLDRILNKNLKIGVGEKFSEDNGKTKKFPVALANKLEDVKNVDIYDGNWVLSRKLDGCVDYYSIVEFEGGEKKFIGDVVKNKIKGKIKSFDGKNVVFEEIEDWMEGVDDIDNTQKQWYEVELMNGKKLKITGNDKLFTDSGWKRVDELNINDKILSC